MLSQRWNLCSNNYLKEPGSISKREREEPKSWRKGMSCCKRATSRHNKAVAHVTSQKLWLSHPAFNRLGGLKIPSWTGRGSNALLQLRS